MRASPTLLLAMTLALPALADAQRVEVRGSRPSARVSARLVIGAHVDLRTAGAATRLTAEDGRTEVRIPVTAAANTGWQVSVTGAPEGLRGSLEVLTVDDRWTPLPADGALVVARGARQDPAPLLVRVRLSDPRDADAAGRLRLRIETADAP